MIISSVITKDLPSIDSFNYLDQNGFSYFAPDTYSRFASSVRATGSVTDHIKYNYNVKFQRVMTSEPYGLDDVTFEKTMWSTRPIYDPNGYFAQNPALEISEGGTKTSRTDRIYQQFQVIASPLEGWNIIGEVNLRIQAARDHETQLQTYLHAVDGSAYLNNANDVPHVYEKAIDTYYMNPNVYSDYSFSVKEKHNFKVMAGFQMEQNTLNNFSAKRDGLLVDDLNVIDTTTGLDNDGGALSPTVSGAITNWATAGFFGRFNYDYDGRYLFEANLRYDGTSRFREDNRWNWFPSFSAGWNIAREEFWGDLSDHISNLKVRASYGELGNQNTTNLYPTYSQMNLGMSDGKVLINGVMTNTASSPDLLNSNMTWETIKTTNIGVDVSALKNRLNVSFDYFIRETNDMVGPAPELPVVLGKSVPKENNTDMKTKGWELSATWRDRLETGFGYSVGLNLSDYTSVITNYPNENKTLSLSSTWASGITGLPDIYYSGQTVGEIWGLTTIDIARTDAEMQQHLASLPNGGQSLISGGSVAEYWTAGDIMYKDLDGDGQIDYGSGTVDDPGDVSVIGNATPRYSFGINLAADYKGFDVSMFFQGVMKRDYSITHPSFFGTGWAVWSGVYLQNHLDYFRDDPTTADAELFGLNTDSYYPRPLVKNKKNQQVQTKYLQDASYIRLKNLQFGYTFSEKIAKKIGLSNFRVFASGENLWTGTSLADMFDPETIDGSNQGLGYPLQSTISFGINASF